ncbi:DUF962 domain-containing protein [Shewanella mesophila]|uniref:DUF962 domain-containing protein n=1 Tax=Shewanella mesophila TaxID=2864208 RepID=UPI001C658AA8|nr:DUF962 domain-containing protein [Shewanella mesophila]QYJ87278.1 DUF962 domain-containing protein [Shewanella mesophila]
MNKRFQNFWEFYPFYLSQHQEPMCRYLHYVGSLLVISVLILFCVTQDFWLLLLMPILGYGCAWLGHFCFEHNQPATFQYPLYSFIGDWLMFAQWLGAMIRTKAN